MRNTNCIVTKKYQRLPRSVNDATTMTTTTLCRSINERETWVICELWLSIVCSGRSEFVILYRLYWYRAYFVSADLPLKQHPRHLPDVYPSLPSIEEELNLVETFYLRDVNYSTGNIVFDDNFMYAICFALKYVTISNYINSWDIPRYSYWLLQIHW